MKKNINPFSLEILAPHMKKNRVQKSRTIVPLRASTVFVDVLLVEQP